MLNPAHPGSHNALARVLMQQNKRIPSILAFSRFLVLEPRGNRAKENWNSLQKLIKGNVQKKSEQSVTINIDASSFEKNNDGKPTENNFATADLLLSFDAGLDYDKKNADKTEVENFIRKFNNLCSALNESNDKKGFYWEFYVPYFTSMKAKALIENFAYVAFAVSDDKSVNEWLSSHSAEIESFYQWSDSFVWKK